MNEETKLRYVRLAAMAGLWLGLLLPGFLGVFLFLASANVYVIISILLRKSRRPRDPYSVPEAIHPR